MHAIGLGLAALAKDPPVDALLPALDRGERVVIPTSRRRILFILTVAVTLGVLLALLLALVIHSSIEQHADWLLIATSLRVWAIVVAILVCLVLAPVGVALRLRRSETLVLSQQGLALARRDQLLPGTVASWSDIERIELQRLKPGAPSYVTYWLTEEAAAGRGVTSLRQRQRFLWPHLALKPRKLHRVLVAAHERYGR